MTYSPENLGLITFGSYWSCIDSMATDFWDVTQHEESTSPTKERHLCGAMQFLELRYKWNYARFFLALNRKYVILCPNELNYYHYTVFIHFMWHNVARNWNIPASQYLKAWLTFWCLQRWWQIRGCTKWLPVNEGGRTKRGLIVHIFLRGSTEVEINFTLLDPILNLVFPHLPQRALLKEKQCLVHINERVAG